VHLLLRMEQEVLGKVVIKGKQEARVRLAEPLSLADYADAYKADKRGTVSAITQECEAKVQRLLEELGSSK
jgi:hypothetical protein